MTTTLERIRFEYAINAPTMEELRSRQTDFQEWLDARDEDIVRQERERVLNILENRFALCGSTMPCVMMDEFGSCDCDDIKAMIRNQ